MTVFRRIYCFTRNCDGSIAQAMGFFIVPLVLAAGGAIDYARWNSARVQVTEALDAAVLAGTNELDGSAASGEKARIVAESYFANAVAAKQSLVDLQTSFAPNTSYTELTGSAKGKLETSFLTLTGLSTIPVEAQSAAQSGVSGAGSDLEIALVLDVTGSMCDDDSGPCSSSSKMDALKAAAKQLVNTVVWQDQSTYTSKISIVPFNQEIRMAPDGAGAAIMQKLTNMPPTWSGWFKECNASSGASSSSESWGAWSCTNWVTSYKTSWKIMPCVTDRMDEGTWSFINTDVAPGPDVWFNGYDGSRMPLSESSSDTPPTSGLGLSSADPMIRYTYNDGGYCWEGRAGNEVMPLNNDKDALIAKIEGLEAFGATGGALGTAMGWYSISPNFASVWPAASEPQSYSKLTELGPSGRPKLRKIAIIMTDGAYNAFRGWKEQDINFASEGAMQICAGMKDKGIEVFTVGFDLDSLPALQKSVATETLKECGSTIDHFYQSFDEDQLAAAFEAIGAQLSESRLRLTK